MRNLWTAPQSVFVFTRFFVTLRFIRFKGFSSFDIRDHPKKF